MEVAAGLLPAIRPDSPFWYWMWWPHDKDLQGQCGLSGPERLGPSDTGNRQESPWSGPFLGIGRSVLGSFSEGRPHAMGR